MEGLVDVGMIPAEGRTASLGGCRRPLGGGRVMHSGGFAGAEEAGECVVEGFQGVGSIKRITIARRSLGVSVSERTNTKKPEVGSSNDPVPYLLIRVWCLWWADLQI